MIGKPAEELVLPEDVALIEASVKQLNLGRAEQATTVVRMPKKDGTLLWMEGNAHVIHSPDPSVDGAMVVIVRDIAERKKLEDALAAQALTDALTGLANRRAFDEALNREWRRTFREGTKISLLLLDLDHFKELNDHYGHTVGDDCLRVVAATIKNVVRRPRDVVARYGGEEIGVILYDTDLDGAANVAEEILGAIAALHLPHAENLEGGGWVTASIGVATALAMVGGTIRMPESLLVAVDGALYKAKRGGRNRVATTLLLAPNEKL
jgi:diguanylate cyclase (GGDEF)-like protein